MVSVSIIMQEVEAKKARGDTTDGRTGKRRVAGPGRRDGEASRVEKNRGETLDKGSETKLYLSCSAAGGVKMER